MFIMYVILHCLIDSVTIYSTSYHSFTRVDKGLYYAMKHCIYMKYVKTPQISCNVNELCWRK